MKNIDLIALDLDGTLFNADSQISPRNIQTIHQAIAKGAEVVISTGRPYAGLPFEQLSGTGIRYAITTNGSAIYEITSGKCLLEETMDESMICPILDFLITKDIHMDAFINGKGYTPIRCVEAGEKLHMPAALKEYITKTRIRVDDLSSFIREKHYHVQKMTLNFFPDQTGILKDRKEVQAYLENIPSITCVSGGNNNLEFTRAGIDKGTGLYHLAQLLGIDFSATLAIGDSENDLAIIKAAGIGVAMGNATPEIKNQADYVTGSNTEDGVASAIEHFMLS